MGEFGNSNGDKELYSDSNLFQEANYHLVSPLPLFVNESVAFTSDEVLSLVSKLSLYEKISLVFLLYDNAEGGLRHMRNVLEERNDARSHINDPIYMWYAKHSSSSNECSFALLEGLVLIQSFDNCTRKCFMYDALKIFRPNDTDSRLAIHPIKKLLYKIAESLTIDEAKNLINSIEEETQCLQQQNWPNKVDTISEYLEIYFLLLISKQYIDLNNKTSLSMIVNKLNSINRELASFIESKIRCSPTSNERDRRQSIQSFNEKIVDEKGPKGRKHYPIIDKRNIGLCLIINQQNFKKNFSEREGSEVDREELCKTFRSLNFEVRVLEDLDKHQICCSIVNEVNNLFKPNIHSVFVLILLSHGKQGYVYGVDGEEEAIDNIRNSLGHDCCEVLDGKPKVLIIQACQGRMFYEKPDDVVSDGIDVAKGVSDLLVCIATIPGFKAFRHKKNGSWYIQALCKQLNETPEEDLYNILTIVNDELRNYVVAIHGKKVSMLPEFRSCLSKSLYFKF